MQFKDICVMVSLLGSGGSWNKSGFQVRTQVIERTQLIILTGLSLHLLMNLRTDVDRFFSVLVEKQLL